jgi:type IV pilus assembly protein PilB
VVPSPVYGAPLVDLDAIDLTRLATGLLDPKLALSNKIIPLAKRGNRLIVVTADPTDHSVAEQIKFSTQLSVDWVIAEHSKLVKALESVAKKGGDNIQDMITGDVNLNEFEIDDESVNTDTASNDGDEVEDAPIVKFLQKMLIDAFNMRASDLHFEPYEHQYRIRFRIDGELREIASPPPGIKDKLASRIKVISRLDISEKRVPQDGRMKLKIGADRVIDFRVSTLPTLFGEKIVIRILDPSSAKLGIDALGYEPEEKERLLSAIKRPYGMILVTGPTGSGKTVSLYTCLNILNTPAVNIATAEDPSEINLPGVNQVNVNEKAGLTFATALKSFLRQDPDIIMVGEIRDLETADIAIKAAQTGHLVLSTLHTNDAPTTLTRMRNMGIAPFNIASSVILITAQRLARKLCPICKRPTEIPHEALLEAGFKEEDLDGTWMPYEPVGCDACNNGYKGRLGIYQVMPISEETQRIILRDGSALEIAEQADIENVRSLRTSGLHKVKKGLTSLEEVLAVTNE